MTPVPPKPDGNPYAVTPNGTPILVRDDRLEWIDDWTNALAVTLDDNFRPHDDTGALITPGSIGAANQVHTHTPAEIDMPRIPYAATMANGGNSTTEGHYVRLGALVIGTFQITLGTNRGGLWTVSLPSVPADWRMGAGTGGVNGPSAPFTLAGLATSGAVGLLDLNDGHRLGGANPPTGWTWAAGQVVTGNFYYLEE